MAEQNIMSVAGDFSINKYTPAPWICRDDNDDYWTVIRDTDGNLRVYKSIDDGAIWVLKKTLTNADWTGSPLPTNAFQIINLVGQDKIYVFLCDGAAKQYLYGWIFNVAADTNQKDMDNQILNVSAGNLDSHVAWDDFNDRLLVVSAHSGDSTTYFGDIPALGTGTLNYKGSTVNYDPLSYYISPSDGYGYFLSYEIGGSVIRLHKKRNDSSYQSDLISISITLTPANVIFANVVTDSDGHPIIGYIYNDGGITPKFKFEKRDKDNLSTILSSGSQDISSVTVPSSAYLTIDGNNNLYFVFTDGNDGECYYIRYDGSWGSEIKVSSDNDGQLAMPEVRVPIADNKILVAYQATS